MRAPIPVAAAAFGVAWALGAPLAAQTQVSPFQPPQPPFGLFISGVLRGPASHPVGPIGANQIGVDQNGDTQLDAIYDLPPAIRSDPQSPARWSFEDRLSPTQRVLYTRRFPNTAGHPNPPPVCDNEPSSHEVILHWLGTPPAMTLLGSACVRGPLSRQPTFYEPTTTALLRTAMVVAAPDGPSQEVAWFDLANGGAGEDATYEPNVSVTAEGVLVSPFGNAFYLRHRTGQLAQDPRYSIVDLCADPTGGSVATLTEPAGATSIRVDHRNDGGSLFADVTFTFASGPARTESFALANCFGGPPPTLRRLTVTVGAGGSVGSSPPGIACLTGTCQAEFTDGTPVLLQAFPSGAGVVFTGWSGDCSGSQPTTQVLMDVDRVCTATFGTVQLGVAKSAGAATAVPGQTLTYSLTASNAGSAPATGVVVSDTVPAGTDFVAAPGGTLSGQVVTWPLGTLGSGASAQVQLQVRPRCQVSQVTNAQYAVDADLVFPVAGPAVTTPVAAPPLSPVTAIVTSVPDRNPLRGGDRITHTITLTNTGPADHPFLRLVTHLGDAASLDALVDAGTGTFSFVPPTTLTWIGPLAAGASTSLVLVVRIDDCFLGTATSLNSGSPVAVFNFCSQQVGSALPPGPFPLQRPVDARLSALDPRRGTQGTLPALRYIAGRPGEALDLQLVVANQSLTNQPNVTVNAVLPAGLSAVGDPPFVAPTDPGAAWDAATRTVSWNGTLPASATATVTFRVSVDAGARCWMNLAVQGSHGACSDIRTGSVVLSVPGTPAGPHVLAVDVLEGLYLWEPGVDRNFREELCVHAGEFHAGLGRTPAGDLWMTGLASFRANLSPLEIEAFAPGFLDTAALVFEEENDAAGDPTDGSVVVVGGRGGAGGLKRYDPSTRQVVDIAALPSRAGRVVVEPDGTIAAMAGDRIYRLDPTSPGNPQVLTFPGYAGLGAFDRDADGDYVVLAARAAGGGFVEDLVAVDPATGAVTPIVADLDTATGNTTVPHGPLAVAPDGTVYLARSDGRELYRLDRSTAPPVVTALSAAGTILNPVTPGVFLTSIRDLVFVDGAPAPAADLTLAKTASPDPVPAGTSLTYVLTVTNLGPDTAVGAAATDELPSGVTFDATASDPACRESGGTVLCAVGDVAAGQSVSMAFVVGVQATANGALSNTATVDSATSDPDGGNDRATATVTVTPPPPPMADLALVKSASPDPLVVGEDLTYTLVATNAGPDGAPAVRVTDPLPGLLRFDPSRSGPSCGESAGTVTCDLGTVESGAAAAATIAARPLFRADLAVTLLDVAPAGPVVLGDSLVYTAVVTNHGPGDARDVRLATLASAFDDAGNTVGPPLDVVIGSAHASRGSCAAQGTGGRPPLACALGTMLPGESARVTIVATPNTATTAVGQPSPPLTNAAHVSTGASPLPDLDPHAENDLRTVETVVLPVNSPDLAVTRAEAQPGTPLVLGATVAYDLEVANLGAAEAADVRLYTLASGFGPGGAPAGPPLDVTVVSMSAGQGTCLDLGGGNGPVECALGTLAPGGRVQVSVVARPDSPTVTPGLPDSPLVSRSRVTTGAALFGTITDPHRANDEAAVASVVLPATTVVDLGVTAFRVAPAAPVVQGADLAYTLTVANFGPEEAAGVMVYTMAAAFTAEGRPAGPPLSAKLVSIVASQGTCSDLGGGSGPVECQLGTLAAGASVQISLAVTPDAPTAQVGAPDVPLVNGASVTTTAALAGNDADAHRANNQTFVASTVLERLPATVGNTASVVAGVGDPNLADNSALASTPIVAPAPSPEESADLQATLMGPPQASLGAGTPYALAVLNAGPDSATGAGVLITLSRGLTLSAVSSTQGSCAGSPTVFCALGDLASGAAAGVTLVVRPEVAGMHAITAEASATSIDPAPADNRAVLPIEVGGPPPAADLVLTKTAEGERITAGSAIGYQLRVSNQGPAPATGVRVVDQLPSGTSFVLATPSQGACSLEPTNGAVVCPLGTLLAGAEATIAIVVSVPAATPAETVLVNRAGAVSEQSEPTPADNEDLASVTVDAPPPPVGENMDPTGAGEQFAYGENVGWINLEPLGSGGPGVEVRDNSLAGWMWGENVGWCSLSCAGTSSCAAVPFGVTNDGAGNLAGWAWCENAGWISFSCANTASCAAAGYGVTIDPASGVFAGRAWGENVGWIGFAGAGAAPFRIVTAWRAAR